MFQRLRIFVRRCSAADTLRYSQDLQAKDIPSPARSTTAVDNSDIVFFPSSEMTDIGMAF